MRARPYQAIGEPIEFRYVEKISFYRVPKPAIIFYQSEYFVPSSAVPADFE